MSSDKPFAECQTTSSKEAIASSMILLAQALPSRINSEHASLNESSSPNTPFVFSPLTRCSGINDSCSTFPGMCIAPASAGVVVNRATLQKTGIQSAPATVYQFGGPEPMAIAAQPTTSLTVNSPIVITQQAQAMMTTAAAAVASATWIDNRQLSQKRRKERQAWTREEDDKLVLLVQEEEKLRAKEPGPISWVEISKKLGSARTYKQCRDRWTNSLRPGIKKGKWTSEEEELIKDMYATFGPQWCIMAKYLTNRADSDIKNKWYSMIRTRQRRKEQNQASLSQECTEKSKGSVHTSPVVDNRHIQPQQPSDQSVSAAQALGLSGDDESIIIEHV